MPRRTRLWGASAGVAAAICAGLCVPAQRDAYAARARGRLRVLAVSVDGQLDVQLNQRIEIRFNARVAKKSLTDGSIAVVEHDGVSLDGGFGPPRPGTLKRFGGTVVFTPRLPTHLRDPEDGNGAFYPPGDPRDDAYENGAFRPGQSYAVLVSGRDTGNPVRSGSGRLRRTELVAFQTADGFGQTPLYSTADFADRLPARAVFVNPPDTPLSASDGYAALGGTPGVPKAATITVFGNGVPLDPIAARAPGGVELLKLAPAGSGGDPVAVAGDALLDQSGPITTLTFRPDGLLDDLATYALRIDKSVTDIAGVGGITEHAERRRLLSIYEWLDLARRTSPTVPLEELPDPPADWIPDWPVAPAARGALKARMLEVGDATPVLLDPRVFAVFTVRAEPPTSVQEAAPAALRRGGGGTATVTRIVTPLGLCGSAGSGSDVSIAFVLADARSRDVAVDAQYGIDIDDDGTIEEEEYRDLTPDLRAAGNTGALVGRRPANREVRFPTDDGDGRLNVLVWNSEADGVSQERVVSIWYRREGRELRSPGEPDAKIFEPAGTGVVVRVRARRGRHASREWVYTRPFELVNGTAPDLTIDDVVSSSATQISWSAIDEDSEDINGNGVLDVLEAEDRNGNGVLDQPLLAVAFDFVVLAPGQDVSGLSPAELAALDWQECTRDEGSGDPDVGQAAGWPPGVGHVFAWDHATDGVQQGDRVVLRGRTFDETHLLSQWIYRTAPTTVGE